MTQTFSAVHFFGPDPGGQTFSVSLSVAAVHAATAAATLHQSQTFSVMLSLAARHAAKVRRSATRTFRTVARRFPIVTVTEVGQVLNESIPADGTGNIARIGVTEFSTIQAAHNAAASGGTINIRPGRWTGTKILLATGKPITVVGDLDAQGRLPHLDAVGQVLVNGIFKGAQQSSAGTSLTVRNVGFMNATNSDNAPCIINNPSCRTLDIRFCIFRDSDNSILTSTNTPLGNFLIEDCLLWNCGRSGGPLGITGHNLYIGSTDLLTMRRVESRLPAGGHCVKSRARQMIMENCTVTQSLISLRAVDYPNGGNLRISDCTISKPVSTVQSDLIGIWPEGNNTLPAGGDGRTQAYLIERCTLNNQKPGGIIVNNSYQAAAATCFVNFPTFPPGSSQTMLGPVVVTP